MSLSTRLDAVNTILGAAGESPVSSITGLTADASAADALITEISREVQSEGWHFNTEKGVPFTPDSDGAILVPDTVLQLDVDPYLYPLVDVVQRGPQLYDRKNRTNVFTASIEAEVIYLLTFEELPEAARRYITVKAARCFHDRFVGSEVLHRFTADDETRARMALEASNLDNEDNNIFTGNATFAASLRRR